MVKNPHKLKEFERNVVKNTRVNFKKNLKIMDEMYKHARSMHDFTKDKFSVRDIEHLIRYAKAINSV